MTDTTIRNGVGGQFCGNCGAAVRAYWNSCAACGTPLEVTPAASLEPAPAEPPPPAPAPAPAPTPRAWPGATRDATETQPNPPWAPDAPPPAWSSPPPPPSPPPRYAPTGSPYAPPPAAYPPGPTYTPPAGYPPQQTWSTAQYPAATPSYQPSYTPDPRPKSRSGLWIALTVVLALLFLGAGAYGVTTASTLSSKKSDLVTRTRERDVARTALATMQGQLNDANTAKENQSLQLAAFKACISDLNILFNSTMGTPAEKAADQQAQKDCVPLGLG